MGFFEVLTLIFVVMKLTGVIAWSWWWVFSPLLPAICIYILAILVFVFVVK